MGVKGQSGPKKQPPTANAEQLRLAQLHGGKPTGAEAKTREDSIQMVATAAKCKPLQAAAALDKSNDDLNAAVEYILAHPKEDESWINASSKKERRRKKKKEQEEKSSFSHGAQSFRGRGGYSERGGPLGSREASLSVPRRPSGRGGRGGSWNARPQPITSKAQDSTQKPVGTHPKEDENIVWESGPLEFTSTVVSTASASASYAVPSSSNTVGPISFAAVAAAAARREQERNKPPSAPVAVPALTDTEPVRESSPDQEFTEYGDLSSEALPEEVCYSSSDSSVGPTQELVPGPEPEEAPACAGSIQDTHVTAPQLQANETWTSQLKSDLGVGGSIAAEVAPMIPASTASVEFSTKVCRSVLTGYTFGYYDEPAACQIPETALRNLGAGDYTLRRNPLPSLSSKNCSSLGFGEPLSISYSPSVVESEQQHHSAVKSSSHAPQPYHSASSPQHHSHHQQQQTPPMFQQQLPYSAFPPYMGMYNAMQGVRPDNHTTMFGQYPLNTTNMGLASFMTNAGLAQQSLPNTQHPRPDGHGMDATKFQSLHNSRDQSQTSTVQPPPGFGSGMSSVMSPQMNMPLHPQEYMAPNSRMPFYPPNNGGRQMYAQDDERKTTGARGHAAQPPQFHHNSANYLDRKRMYNWD